MNHQAAYELWTPRVREWKVSGLSATTFGKQHNISPSNLYAWARRIQNRTQERKSLPIARVLRNSSHDSRSSAFGSAIVVELAMARVVIPRGFDRATLADVIDVLSARNQRGGQ